MLPELLDSKGVLGRGYDIILAAETIYSPDSQKQLLQCIKKVWLHPHGDMPVRTEFGTAFHVDIDKAKLPTCCCSCSSQPCERLLIVYDDKHSL